MKTEEIGKILKGMDADEVVCLCIEGTLREMVERLRDRVNVFLIEQTQCAKMLRKAVQLGYIEAKYADSGATIIPITVERLRRVLPSTEACAVMT